MIRRKDTSAGRNRNNEARQAEKRWRATSPEAAALPPEEIRQTRAERRALLEFQLASAKNRTAHQQAVKALRRERDNAKETERLRQRRKRPHKHLPAGVGEESVEVVGREAGRLLIRFCPANTPGSETLISLPATYLHLELMTPELQHNAAALRVAFDIERNQMTDPPVMLQEIVAAIRLATAAARAAWIPIALNLVHLAVLHGIVRARSALDFDELNGQPAPSATPEALYEVLVNECLRWVCLPPPSDVSPKTISWMLGHLAVGATRGGGRTRRISAKRMRTILADEKSRARHVKTE